MTMLSSNFQSLLEPKLRKVFFETYDEIPEQYPDVFNVLGSKKAVETDQHISGLGMPGVFTGVVEYDDPVQGDAVTYAHVEYSKGIQVERKLVDDDLYNVINKRSQALARGFRARVETECAAVLNNGFGNTGYDGVALFANNHPLHKAGTNTGNNLTTGALTDANLKAARVLMRETVDDAGIKAQFMGNNLIVPVELEYTALEITQSTQKAGTADNDINTLRGRVTVTVLDYLTSATAWFLQDRQRHQLNHFWRVKPEFKGEEGFDTLVAKYRGYMRFSCGYSDWRGIVASTGV